MDNSGAQVKKCVLLGAGGHARVVLDALLLEQPELEPVIIDINPAIKELMGFPVQQMALSELCGNGITHYVIGVGSVGAVGRRRKLQVEAELLGWYPLRVIHPSAVVARDVELGDGVQIMAGVVVNAGTMIGAQAILNTGAVIEHECRVGAFAHIAPRAVLLEVWWWSRMRTWVWARW